MIANWVSALGIAIEFVGFVILALELMQTNNASLAEAKALAAETSAFDAMTGWYDSDNNANGTDISGGVLGKIVQRVKQKEAEVVKSKRKIIWGICVSAFGALLQLGAAVAQALPSACSQV